MVGIILSKIWEWLKKPFIFIGAIVGILLLYIRFLKDKNATLEGQAEENETKKTDAVLEQQQKDLATQHAEAISQLETEKGRKLTPDELNDFLNKL